MTDFEFISDLHKDARGYRPGPDWMKSFDAQDWADKLRDWNGLEKELEESMAEDRLREQVAILDFEADVQYTISLGARDRATALRWMTECEVFYNEQDVEHWVWKLGFLFTDEGRAVVQELMEIVEISDWDYRAA